MRTFPPWAEASGLLSGHRARGRRSVPSALPAVGDGAAGPGSRPLGWPTSLLLQPRRHPAPPCSLSRGLTQRSLPQFPAATCQSRGWWAALEAQK